MRILIATSHRGLVGGVERYLQVVIPGLLKAEHDVSIVHEYPLHQGREPIDCVEQRLPVWCLQELGREATQNAIGKWRPDIVYSQGLEDSTWENTLLNAYPVVLYAHNYYGTCGTGRKCYAFPQLEPCERRFGPMCLLLHYPRRCGGLNPWTMWRTFQRQAILYSRLNRYRAILVASTHMRQEFVRHGVNPANVRLAPLPVAGSDRQAPPSLRSPEGRILFAARLTDVKGGRNLIEAIRIASQTLGRALTLTVAGDGPEKIALLKLADKLQVRARFVGWVNAQTKVQLLEEADLLAVPSLWPEPFGLVGVEAGCMGIPAVGYALGGITEWLIPGLSGELAPADPPTVEGLAAAIVRALTDTDHYQKLCRGAWEQRLRFTPQSHLQRLEKVMRHHFPGEAPQGIACIERPGSV